VYKDGGVEPAEAVRRIAAREQAVLLDKDELYGDLVAQA
jgi:hypothetical protein